MFLALNDEEFAIREIAITILGRLALRNPAYVMPSLRRTLIQQLTELGTTLWPFFFCCCSCPLTDCIG